MNKKQIKQDKLLKKKALYQEYWKTIFIQSNRVKDKIKDGDTKTNIVQLQSKEEGIQNKEILEQGFDKVLSEQNHILKFPKNENPIQENRILQQKTFLQNNTTQVSPQPQIDEQIKLISIETQNINQINTIIDTKSLGQGNNQIDVKKDKNYNVKQNQQVLINVPLLISPQEQQNLNIQTQINKQQQQQQQQQSLQPIIRNIKRIDQSINECKQTNCQFIPSVQHNIHQHQNLLIKDIHDIPKDLSQTKQSQKNKNNKINKDTRIKKQFERTQQSEHFLNHQIQNKSQDQSNIVQQQTSIIDTKNNTLVNDQEEQQIQLQNDVLNQDNIKQQSELKDNFNHEQNTASNQSVTRNQLKAVHKVMRTLNEKLHQDDMKIQVIWDEVLAQQSDLVPNFEKFIQCIQFLHDLEKAHFDQQKLTAQLL